MATRNTTVKKAAPKAAEKLFEGYERREAKILAALKPYGIKTIEECRDICLKAGFDPYKIVEETQPICFENAKWAYTVGAAMAVKKGNNELLSLLNTQIERMMNDGTMASIRAKYEGAAE